MILTQCAACAKPLAHDAPRCVRCWTRYCDASCQLEHWSNGHKKQCKKIARGGGAEQFHAEAKYREALAAAVVESAPRIPPDAICYICRNDGSAQGLVNGCGCHGGAGIAHVTCLVRMAQMSVKDDEEGMASGREGAAKWSRCFECDCSYHGAVRLALAWAGWKTYLGRPETDLLRCDAMGSVGDALITDGDAATALPVLEASLALILRVFPHAKHGPIVARQNIAICLDLMGRNDEALRIQRLAYAERKALSGRAHRLTIEMGTNLAYSLMTKKHFDEARQLTLELLRVARQSLSRNDEILIMAIQRHAEALCRKPLSNADLVEAEALIQEAIKVARHVFGPDHPRFLILVGQLEDVRHNMKYYRGKSV